MKSIIYLIVYSIFLLTSHANAVSPKHDEYYSDDIFTAIEEAKQRTHHYNYSRSRRYQRSTSQSIQIPRLLNKEMDQTTIKSNTVIDLKPTAKTTLNTDTKPQITIPQGTRLPASPTSESSVSVTAR